MLKLKPMRSSVDHIVGVSWNCCNSEPRACKAIRVVDIREQVLKEKCQKFLDKGWIRGCHLNWAARGLLAPKPGVNTWRLVIDYRYLNSCLKGQDFPLPVIEDTLLSQAGNHLWTLPDLEDGFHQMPLEEYSRFLTVFCTPFGVFEWSVLPMGVKLGPAAFKRILSWCLAHHQVPSAQAYIDTLIIRSGQSCWLWLSAIYRLSQKSATCLWGELNIVDTFQRGARESRPHQRWRPSRSGVKQ